MCALCSAVPTVLTLGVVAENKQRQACKDAMEAGEPAPRKRPFLALAMAGAFGIMVTSLLYHTQFRGV
jgi:hypothetical protein